MKRFLQLWTAVCLLALVGGAQSSERMTQTTSEAFDLESGELLYREVHCVNADVTEREVFYKAPDGELLARKLVDYRSGATTPSFEQQNFYSNETIRVGLEAGQVNMVIVDNDSQQTRSQSAVKPGDKLPVVIDAGFDEFVREHWDQLVAGEKLEFQFPFADRETLVELRIGPLACSYETSTDQCFRLDLANWFFRLLVAPIELGYDREDRQLVRYRGLSNIGDGNGNGLVVDLRYDYKNAPGTSCSALQSADINSSDSAAGDRIAVNN